MTTKQTEAAKQAIKDATPGATETVKPDEEEQITTFAQITSKLGELLTPAQVASLFNVSPKTIKRWANDSKLPQVRTLGGHARFRTTDVVKVMSDMGLL